MEDTELINNNTKSIENDALRKLYELYLALLSKLEFTAGLIYCKVLLLFGPWGILKGVTLFQLIALLFCKVFHSLESKVLQRHYSSQWILHSVTFTNIIRCCEHTQQRFKTAI